MLLTIKQIVSDKVFQEDVISFLTDICRIDTTPNPDIGTMAANEKKLFDIIRQRLLKFSFTDASVVEKRISPAIEDHPAFSRLHFTRTAAHPDGLGPEIVYKDRYNLLYFINGLPAENGKNPALNAHIDIVAPFFPPEMNRDTILGRGV
jgi:hypothetical protein